MVIRGWLLDVRLGLLRQINQDDATGSKGLGALHSGNDFEIMVISVRHLHGTQCWASPCLYITCAVGCAKDMFGLLLCQTRVQDAD